MIVDENYLDKFWINDEKNVYQVPGKLIKRPKLRIGRLPDDKKIISINVIIIKKNRYYFLYK